MTPFRVLVVEDDATIAKFMQQTLHETGAVETEYVHFASCAAEANAFLGQFPYHVVSLDGSFPETENGPMDRGAGLKLIQRLRDVNCRCIFFSGNDRQVESAATMQVGTHPVIARLKSKYPLEKWAELIASFKEKS